MRGRGSRLTCENCGKTYELTEYGYLRGVDMTSEEEHFTHVPDWYRWERECVRQELLEGSYHLQVPVDICMLVDSRCIYRVGGGVLEHTARDSWTMRRSPPHPTACMRIIIGTSWGI